MAWKGSLPLRIPVIVLGPLRNLGQLTQLKVHELVSLDCPNKEPQNEWL